MSDDPAPLTPRHSSRIALGEDREVRYWTDALGIDEPTLRGAIQAVGVRASEVREYLDMRRTHAHRWAGR